MIKVLLLDNDEMIHSYFEKIIDKTEIDFHQERKSEYLEKKYLEESATFDLAFMNLFLDDGFYIVDFLEKKNEIFSSSKLILLSPMADFELFQNLLQLGAYEILQKPFALNSVLHLISEYKKSIQKGLS
jgi:response regulator of citrate/malate metabolism